jgi:transposase
MYCIGIDISKSTLNVYIPNGKIDLEIENSSRALKSLYGKLAKIYKKEMDKLIFIYEPTSNYSSLIHRFCSQKKIKVFTINPKQSSNFAKAIAQRGKSDQADARMLSKAIGVAREDEISVPVIDPIVDQIKELMGYYAITVKHRVGLSNHLESLSAKETNSPLIKRLKRDITRLKTEENEIMDEIYQLIQDDPSLCQKYEAIISIDGIGKVVAITLLHLFLKYPHANQRQITSLAGLDPIARESGTSIKGKSRISKAGGKLYRGALFMSALVATRYNEHLKCFYTRLKEKGKHSTVAHVAVMRKLVIIAHSLFKSGEHYDQTRHLSH